MKLTADSITNLNAAAVQQQGAAAIRAGDARVDFSAVRRCDTAAVACVLAWLREARAAGRPLELVSLPADLLSLAKLYGVDQLIAPGPSAA
jgi:phospholipid transport system transporter-binding protein